MATSSNASQIIYFNGELRQSAETSVSPFDHGLLTGDGVFETLISYDGVPFATERHYARMKAGAEVMGLRIPTAEELNQTMRKVLEANALKSARIRVTITGGESPLSSERGTNGETVMVAVSPAPEYSATAKVIVVPFVRNEMGALAGLKTTSYGENVVAQRIARERGAHEAIFGNTRGNLCEGSMTNVFLVKDDVISTPPISSGCLPGVTRALTIELAKSIGLDCREVDIPMAELSSADEVFLTSTLREIQPVEVIDDTQIPVPENGICSRLQKLFKERRSTMR